MAVTFKPLYGARTAVTFAGSAVPLNALANGAIADSDAIDNSSSLYQDILFDVYIDGTAAATAWLEVRLICSEDGANWGTWESGVVLGTINLSVDLQRAHFSVANTLFIAPKYMKIFIKNNTGAALHATESNVYYQGINNQAVVS